MHIRNCQYACTPEGYLPLRTFPSPTNYKDRSHPHSTTIKSSMEPAFVLIVQQYSNRGASKSAGTCPPQRTISRRIFTSLALTLPLASVLPANGTVKDGSTKAPSKLAGMVQNNFATMMEEHMVDYERNIRPRKQALFAMIDEIDSPVIADIGIGTGPNLSHMPRHSGKIIGIEPNEYMWPYARKRAAEFGNNLTLVNAHSEQIPLPSDSCDVVITTLTLCSVASVEKSIAEIIRILKPGGMFLFIEHVIAQPSHPILRAVQFLLSPLQEVVADGCHLDRDTGQVIEESFKDVASEIHVDRFEATSSKISIFADTTNLFRPHVAGYVRKRSV